MRNITKDSKHTPKFGLLIQTGFQNLEQECKLESKIWTMIILVGFQNLEHLC